MEREVSGLWLDIDIKQGVILEGGSDSWGSSEESGSVDCRLAAYLGVKPVGSAYPPHRG